MSLLSSFFNLDKTLSSAASALSSDVLNVKKALGGLGFYKTPDFGATKFPDSGLFDGLMKPGGPTELGLNKLLGDSGIGDKLFRPAATASPLRWPGAAPVSPKPGTSSPGLTMPEGQMQQKPLDRLGRIVPYPSQSQPFNRMGRTPPITPDASASNGRTIDGLLKSFADGSLPGLFADSLGVGKAKAAGEFGDFMGQLRGRDPDRAARFGKAVMDRLPEQTRTRLAQLLDPAAKSAPMGGAINPPAKPSAPEVSKPSEGASGYKSPILKTYLEAIAREETREDPNGGYRVKNSQGYLGRYQLGEYGLIDAGLKTRDKKWTGKYGVKSEQDFLNNPQAQERAFADYMAKNQVYLRNNDSMKFIGKEFTGKKKEGIKITEDGLLAAAHRRGAGAVRDYLAYQNENGWSSDFTGLKRKRIYEEIETRLRVFQNIRYR